MTGLAWLGLVVAAVVGLLSVRAPLDGRDFAVAIPVGIAIGTLWLGGLRALVFYACRRALLSRRAASAPCETVSTARVALVCCTADDLDPSALRRSAAQTHDVDVVILDDSSSDAGRVTVDEVAAELGALVVRRNLRQGYKAGNLNHYFATSPGHDFFAIVDSDEVLAPTFVARALDHFAADVAVSGAAASGSGATASGATASGLVAASDPIGVVQGRHEAHEGETAFVSEFGPMLGTHVATTQAARSQFGFSMFMGRGALLSREAIIAAGGFPEVVAEDVAFTIALREAGYRVEYAPEIVSTEDFPVDYHAFKKQHGKMVQGATELLRGFGPTIARSRMDASEKLDLLLELTMIPLGSMLGVALFAVSLVTASLGATLFPTWVGLALGLSGVAALLPEAVRRTRRGAPLAGLVFLGRALALYASMLWVSLRSMARVLVGRRAVFTITPKRRSTAGWRATVLAELVVASAAVVVSLAVAGSIAPAMTAIGAAAAAVYLTRFSARGSRAPVAAPERAAAARRAV